MDEIKEEKALIGTLNEGVLHHTIKMMFDGDESHHEISFRGAVVDILNDNGVTEIETRSFSNLKKKVERIAVDTPLNVVFPIAQKKTLIKLYLDGTRTERRSNKHGRVTDIFSEMLKLGPLVVLPNLSFTVLVFDMLEYKREIKTRRGRSRFVSDERIPNELLGKITFSGKDGIKSLVTLPEGEFSSTAFGMANKMGDYSAWETLKVLENAGIIASRKEKRKLLYHSIDNEETE